MLFKFKPPDLTAEIVAHKLIFLSLISVLNMDSSSLLWEAGKMNDIDKSSPATSQIQKLKYEVIRCKKDGEDEITDICNKLSSWVDDSRRQFSDIINLHALSLNRGLDDLNEKICGLETKLSVITKERDDLLNIVNNMGGESHCIKPLQEEEKYHNQNNLSETYSDEVEYIDPNYTQQVKQDEEVTASFREPDETEKGAAERSEQEAMCSSPKKLVQVVGHICQECNLAFSKSEHLSNHIINFHSYVKEPQIQGEKDVYNKVRNHTGHQDTLHNFKEVFINGKIHECEDCSYTTSNRSDINRHWDSVHNSGDKRFKCEVCPYTAAQKARVKYHMGDIHNLGETIKCDNCSYKSAKKSKLKRHIETVHEKKRKHVCPECGYAAAQKWHLKQHMMNRGH